MANSNYNDSQLIEHDDELFIALKKEDWSCTQYPICKFISLEKLSSAYRMFVSMLDEVQIPSIREVALRDPNWNVASLEEIEALEKNNTYIHT